MRIMLVVPEYPPFNIGGGGTVFKNLAENYYKLGHEVIVCFGYYKTASWREEVKFYTENGIKFYRLPELPYPKKILMLRTVMPPNLKSIRMINNIIQAEQPDVAHLHGFGHPIIDFFARRLKHNHINYVFTNHGYPKIPNQKGGLFSFAWNIYRSLYGNYVDQGASKITCVSNFTTQEYAISLQNKVVTISNGIDLEGVEYKDEQVAALKKKLSIKNERIILSVGRITKYKGFQQVISNLNKIKNAKYLIAGPDQDYLAELKKIVKAEKIDNRVVFLGKIDPEKIDLYYQISDIVVIPSEVESFGLVGLEALKNKKCVVSSGAQGLKYLEKSINAYQFHDDNELVKLLNSKFKYQEESFVELYDWKKVAIAYVLKLEDAIE